MYCQNELCGYLNLEHKKGRVFPAFFFCRSIDYPISAREMTIFCTSVVPS